MLFNSVQGSLAMLQNVLFLPSLGSLMGGQMSKEF
ncbi:hypothetical protein Br6_04901 [Rhodococcus sp. Br-6]|nr:hypothetical protein Br6_04901 [Rhodococcus sp. Br-6]